MFIAIAKVTLSIPGSGSLKGKRQVLRKVIDKVKARFNVAIAEVGDLDLWQKTTLGIAAVANDHAFAQESVDKVLAYIEELYVAPVVSRSTEVIPAGGDLYGDDGGLLGNASRGTHRTLAEAEAEAARSGHRTLAEAEEDERDERGGEPRVRPRALPERPPDRTPGRRGAAPSDKERDRAIDELRRRMRGARSDGDLPLRGDDDD